MVFLQNLLGKKANEMSNIISHTAENKPNVPHLKQSYLESSNTISMLTNPRYVILIY